MQNLAQLSQESNFDMKKKIFYAQVIQAKEVDFGGNSWK
jgi:hypothetical protein